MATIPDTPQIADALGALVATGPAALVVNAAVQRLRVLHQLGATEEATAQGLRDRIDALTAERDARPTAEDLEEVEAERDRLQERVSELTAAPAGPYSVPVVQFRAGLIPMRLRLLAAAPSIQAKWDVILRELMILTVVYPREQPAAGLLDLAVADGVLAPEERVALRGELPPATGPG